MDDLVQWLGEQLDEDERIAREALRYVDAHWRRDDEENVTLASGMTAAGEQAVAITADRWRRPMIESPGVVAHVAEWDPARVLREIETKRKLIARGGPFCTSDCDEPGNEPKNPDTNWATPLEHHLDCAAYNAAGALAMVYTERPGYREEWRS